MIDKVYHALLWFAGFQKGEHISDMLARQKKRLGVWWWFFPISTIVLFLAFTIWVFYHIITFKSKRGD